MDDLDDLFASARAGAMQPSEALMARVLTDAAQMQPKPGPRAVPEPEIRASAGFWAGLAALFGGGGVLAGVGSAAVAGLFLGLVQPSVLTSVSDLWAGGTVDQLELMPGIDALLAEE